VIDLIKIKEKIFKEAEEEKRKILLETEKKIKAIEEETQKKLNELERQAEEFWERQIEELKRRELSKLKKEENFKILKAKWDIIENLFNLLIKEIKKDSRYVDLIKEKIKNENIQEIIISSEDFPLLHSSDLANKKIITDNKIKGGFLIKKEKEEIDFTLESLLKELKKRYLKEIDKLLFG